MKKIDELSCEEAKKIQYLFCDIDDTITTEGKLTPEAYQALWNAHNAGIQVIPVTGRPAGWCDLIIRQWPVTAVVGENGAFTYYFKEGQLCTYTHPAVAENAQKKLLEVKEKVLKEIPGTRVSKDQFSRKYDLAIDFNEDEPYLGFEIAEQIKDLCISMGAEAKVSSIHVNTWFGVYDKVSMTKLFMEQVLQVDNLKDCAIFFGDSPNDEPMFGFFPLSCAVANIKPFLDQLVQKPTFIAKEESGLGFTKAVALILEKRK